MAWMKIKGDRMSDNLHLRGPKDASKVNIHESWEVEYWTKHFGVTKDRLVEAVRAVGPIVEDVRRYLKK
jgi:hypothetical protein